MMLASPKKTKNKNNDKQFIFTSGKRNISRKRKRIDRHHLFAFQQYNSRSLNYFCLLSQQK